MRVYRTSVGRPRAIEPQHVDEFYWNSSQVSIDVSVNDTPHDTGLLDQRGNKIMRCDVIAPIGFNRS